jgi:hypothetical protein
MITVFWDDTVHFGKLAPEFLRNLLPLSSTQKVETADSIESIDINLRPYIPEYHYLNIHCSENRKSRMEYLVRN